MTEIINMHRDQYQFRKIDDTENSNYTITHFINSNGIEGVTLDGIYKGKEIHEQHSRFIYGIAKSGSEEFPLKIILSD